MKTLFLMQRSRSNKTTKALYEFSKDPENTLFVSNHPKIQNIFLEEFQRNFITAQNFEVHLLGRDFKNFILDDFMYFKNRDIVYNLIRSICPENVYIFSTSDKIYSKEVFDFVKGVKKIMGYNEISESYLRNQKFNEKEQLEFIKKQIYDLYYNFITDEDTTIIDNDFSIDYKNDAHLLYELGEEQYKIQVQNIYLQPEEFLFNRLFGKPDKLFCDKFNFGKK